MTDEELLRLAAKAAGAHAVFGYNGNQGLSVSWSPVFRGAVPWNPIKDDGDAFRLAVKLKMPVDFWIDFGGEGDQNEQARRAIVRAAAEIGKKMK